MKSLKELHGAFFSQERKIIPTQRVAIVPITRWDDENSYLNKAFIFKNLDERNEFVNVILEHENEVKHNAKILIDECSVSIKLTTKNIKMITEIDKEYAKFADEAYKDIVNRPTK